MNDEPLAQAFASELKRRAIDSFREAYRAHMTGDWQEAVALYHRSLDYAPTAEAHTFLGWAYSFVGRFEEAIVECKKAILLDPEFGNPYNDIGAYLMEMGNLDDAIDYLMQAVRAKRYESRHFAHFNLGRAYELQGQLSEAKRCYEDALVLHPDYTLAVQALKNLERRFSRETQSG